MAFCSKCGAHLADGATYCEKCGMPITAPAATSSASAPAAPSAPVAPAAQGIQADTGMAENVAGLLCYALGWVSGVIFLLIDKRPFVRFHAAQSIVVFGAINILYILAGTMFTGGWMMGGDFFYFGGWEFGALLFTVLRLLSFILWILLMMKAYQGQKYRVPFAAEFAESLAGK